MPLKLTKIKDKSKSKSKQKSDVVDVVIDMYADAYMREQAGKAEVKKAEAERKAALSLLTPALDTVPDDQPAMLKSKRYTLEFGAKGNEREVANVKAIFDLLGAETFFKVATVTLGNIDKYLTDAEKATVLTESRTGSRRVKVIVNTVPE